MSVVIQTIRVVEKPQKVLVAKGFTASGGSGGVQTVNGDPGPHVVLDLAEEIPNYEGVSTGLIKGGVLSVANTTQVNMTALTGMVADYVTNPLVPTYTKVNLPAQTITVTNLTQPLVWLLVNGAGVFLQQTTNPTDTQRRTHIVVGGISVVNGNVVAARTLPQYLPQGNNQLYDLIDALGPFNISGNVLAPASTNLTLAKGSGTVFSKAFNLYSGGVLTNDPHVSPIPLLNPVSMRYITQVFTPTPSPLVTNVDPANYDVGGVITPIAGGANVSTIQRLFVIPPGSGPAQVLVQYGQNTYQSLDEAIAAVGSETFVQNPFLPFAVLIGYIVVKRTAVNLADPAQAKIMQAAKISGNAAGSSSSIGLAVLLAGDQTVADIKTFTSSPVVPTPTTAFQVATKGYTDTGDAASVTTASADATTKANAALASANSYTDAQNANDVHLTGNQTVGGIKTFTLSPVGPDPSTAQQLATKAYVDANAGGTDFWVDYWRGVYNNGTTYNLNEIVRSVNAKGMYRCKVASSLGVAPPSFVPGVNQQFFQPVVPGSHDGAATPITIGMRFTPLVNGQINGLWFYKGASNTGIHVARLWEDVGSVLIGGATNFVGETASGWQFQAFPAPISVTAGTVYVCGVDCPNGNYEFQPQFFAAGSVTRGQITGLAGVFTTTVGTKPTSTFNNNYYSGEIDFTTATPSPDNWEIMVLSP